MISLFPPSVLIPEADTPALQLQPVGEYRFLQRNQNKVSTTLSLDLCPLPHLNLKGHEMVMPRPLTLITLKLYQFHIFHLFLYVN